MEEIKNESIFRRFKIIEQSNKNKLMNLCDSKNITRQDLELILKTITLNENIHPI